MSYYLRHGAEKEGLEIDDQGWVRVDDLLKQKDFKKVTVEKI
jgi:RNA:NAD 2'-phosphotransferase (TPT1/KptA family)